MFEILYEAVTMDVKAKQFSINVHVLIFKWKVFYNGVNSLICYFKLYFA